MIFRFLGALYLWMLMIPSLSAKPLPTDFIVREPPPGSHHTAAYGSIQNPNKSSDTLLKVESPQATIEIHTTKTEQGMAHMMELSSIDIPSNTPVVFQPGKHHLMLMNLSSKLKQGDKVELIFHFKKSGPITATAIVKAL